MFAPWQLKTHENTPRTDLKTNAHDCGIADNYMQQAHNAATAYQTQHDKCVLPFCLLYLPKYIAGLIVVSDVIETHTTHFQLIIINRYIQLYKSISFKHCNRNQNNSGQSIGTLNRHWTLKRWLIQHRRDHTVRNLRYKHLTYPSSSKRRPNNKCQQLYVTQ